MSEPQGVAVARVQANQARARMLGTAEELKHRLSPSTIADNVVGAVKGSAENVVGKVKDGAEQAMHGGVAVAQRRPAAVAAGVAGLVTLLVFPKLVRGIREGRSKRRLAKAERKAATAREEALRDDRGIHVSTMDADPAAVAQFNNQQAQGLKQG